MEPSRPTGPLTLRVGDVDHDVARRALVMGILNRTRDSFYAPAATYELDDLLARAEILGDLKNLGIAISTPLNLAKTHGIRRISEAESNTAVFVVPAQEDLMIAVHVDRMARSGGVVRK